MKRNVLISLILVILWMGFIFFMSSMDASKSNSGSKAISNNVVTTIDKVASAFPDSVEEPQKPTIPKKEDTVNKVNIYVRKSSHGFEYLLLSVLVLNLFFQMKKYTFVFHLYNLLFNFVYACTDEFHQTFVSGRTGQFVDVLIDFGGALLGCLVFFLLYKKVMTKIKNRRKAKRKVKMA